MVHNSGYLAGLKVQIFDFLPRDIFPATFYPEILKKDIQTFRFSDLPVISLKNATFDHPRLFNLRIFTLQW